MAFTSKLSFFTMVCLLMFVMVSLFSQSIDAAPSRFKQSIVPLECYIDAVNSGNGSHLYITPEDCLGDKATDTIDETVVPDFVIKELKEYGQEIPAPQSDQQIDSGPKSREFEPRRGSNRFGIADSLRTDNLVSLLLAILAVLPVSTGLYLFLKSRDSKLG